MYKIAILSAYFGPLPNYVKYWMQSAALNSDIDFYIVNDRAPIEHPDNVHFIRMNLDEFSVLASKKIGLQILSIVKPKTILQKGKQMVVYQ